METVGRYEIVRELGRGGMATVHLARQPDLGRLVALKELGGLRAADRSLTRRFLHEARMAGALSHPNVVTVYDYFEHAGAPYLAMEYVDGGSLRSRVDAELSTAQIGAVLTGLLAGLGHAQRHGIVHRDLKPENVLVTGEGEVKIADFGIAKASGRVLATASLTAAGTTLGTPAYMAPEQALGEAVSGRTDLYAVGVIAFELLVGRTPFADTEAPMAVLMRQVNDPIPPVRSLRPDVDKAFSDWIDGLLAKEPADRTGSADIAREQLEETLLAALGARWGREAALPADRYAAGRAVRSASRAVAVAPTRPPIASSGAFDAFTTAGAGRYADGPTLPPRAVTEPTAVAARSRRPPRARTVMAVLAIVAMAATVAAAVGGNARVPAGGVQPASQSDVIVSPTPSRASGDPSANPDSAAARALARQYDDAARRGGDPGTVASLRRVAAAYRRATRAAERGDKTAYARDVGTAQALTRAVEAPSAAPTPQSGDASPGGGRIDTGGGENADDGGDGGGTAGGGGGENADDGGAD